MSKAGADQFYARFWGVRGSIACPGPDTVRYGGNTPCVEIRCGNQLLIFDAGTGLHCLGNHLAEAGPLNAHIFLSHVHYDHVMGLPFFKPAYAATTNLDIWAGTFEDGLETLLTRFMQPPFFPVPLDKLSAHIGFNNFAVGEALRPAPGIRVLTAPLNHPDGATGYRVEYTGKSICYVTDTEHPDPGPDPNVLDLIQDADLLIYDAAFTDAEYPAFRGWGHSTWEEGVRLCEAANVKRFVAFHHAPEHDDRFLDDLADKLGEQRPGSVVAREGMILYP